MGIRITERSSGLLVTVVGLDDTTETYAITRESHPAQFADVANTLDFVLSKAGAPVAELGTLSKSADPHDATAPKRRKSA